MVLIGISLMACGMIICDYSILFWCQNPLADELNFCPGSNICSHYFVYTFLAVKFTVVKFTVEQMNLPFHTVTSNLELLWTILSTLTRVIFLFYWLEPRVLFVVSPLDRKTCHHHLGGRKWRYNLPVAQQQFNSSPQAFWTLPLCLACARNAEIAPGPKNSSVVKCHPLQGTP